MLVAVADGDRSSGVAEGTVVKEQLTGAMIDAGAELTKKLDESGLPSRLLCGYSCLT
jgi:hypothetical protein